MKQRPLIFLPNASQARTWLLASLLACVGFVWTGTSPISGSVGQAHAQTVNWRNFKRAWPRLWIESRPCVVYKVIDGDTTHVKCNGRKEKLRLVGIDTPETKHPFKPIEYFGPQASARAKSLLPIGSQVWLGFGKRPRNGRLPRGKYRRVLAYLFMPNGKMFNAQMVRQGYAFAMRRYPHVYMQRFIRLENAAKRNNAGMWADRAKVRAMVAGDQAYRRHRKRCKRREGSRYQWVIGDRSQKVYFTRRHRSYFRTNPHTRVLFCSVSEATGQGYQPAPYGYRYRRRGSHTNHQPSHRGGSVGTAPRGRTLIIGDARSSTFRVYRRGRYRVFSSIADAKAAGFKRERKRRTRRSRRSRRSRRGKWSRTKPNCGGKTPIVGNRRSKRYRTPSMRSYKRATKSKNAVYFCTEREAIAAGFIRSKR
jgi:micrococcal nuclease